jgi:hypothetical protein
MWLKREFHPLSFEISAAREKEGWRIKDGKVIEISNPVFENNGISSPVIKATDRNPPFAPAFTRSLVLFITRQEWLRFSISDALTGQEFMLLPRRVYYLTKETS